MWVTFENMFLIQPQIQHYESYVSQEEVKAKISKKTFEPSFYC